MAGERHSGPPKLYPQSPLTRFVRSTMRPLAGAGHSLRTGFRGVGFPVMVVVLDP
jgi:hypothetical protein